MFRSIKNTLIAMICSGVGAVTFWVCCSSVTSDTLGTSPGVKVVVDSFLASSSTSLDANKFLASSLSYIIMEYDHQNERTRGVRDLKIIIIIIRKHCIEVVEIPSNVWMNIQPIWQ